MILHHYIWGDIDIDIVDEVAPHFLMQPSWLHTIDDIRHKIDGIIATDKKIREHDEYYVGSLRNDIISYELVQRVE